MSFLRTEELKNDAHRQVWLGPSLSMNPNYITRLALLWNTFRSDVSLGALRRWGLLKVSSLLNVSVSCKARHFLKQRIMSFSLTALQAKDEVRVTAPTRMVLKLCGFTSNPIVWDLGQLVSVAS